MKGKAVLAIALACVMGAAHAEDAAPAPDPELKKLQDQLALETAKNQIMVARYGAAVTPKSGAIAGLDKLNGMAYEHLPMATQKVGDHIGRLITDGTCKKTVIVDSQGISAKVAESITYTKQIEELRAEIAKAGVKDVDTSPRAKFMIGIPAAMAVMGGLVSVAGLFKSDYEVSGSTLSVDQDWLIASMLASNENVTAERYPDRTAVDQLVADLEDLKAKAGEVSDDKKKKALTKKVTTLQAALMKPDDKGMLPLVTTAFYQSLAGKKGKCLAIITNSAASPMLLSKDTIWGKGGRAFLYMPVQASVVVLNNKGRPNTMFCRVATVSTPIKLKSLTVDSGLPPIPWSGDRMTQGEPRPCGGSSTFTAAVQNTGELPDGPLDLEIIEGKLDPASGTSDVVVNHDL